MLCSLNRCWLFQNLFHHSLLWLFSHQVMSDSSRPHGLQHARLPGPSPSRRVCPSSCPSSQWCHPTISPSVTIFYFCCQSFPASGSFPMSWLFTSGGQSIGASASALNIQGWFPLGLTGLISFQPKGLSGVFPSTTIRQHQFFGARKNHGPALISVYDYWENCSFDYMDPSFWKPQFHSQFLWAQRFRVPLVSEIMRRLSFSLWLVSLTVTSCRFEIYSCSAITHSLALQETSWTSSIFPASMLT